MHAAPCRFLCFWLPVPYVRPRPGLVENAAAAARRTSAHTVPPDVQRRGRRLCVHASACSWKPPERATRQQQRMIDDGAVQVRVVVVVDDDEKTQARTPMFPFGVVVVASSRFVARSLNHRERERRCVCVSVTIDRLHIASKPSFWKGTITLSFSSTYTS